MSFFKEGIPLTQIGEAKDDDFNEVDKVAKIFYKPDFAHIEFQLSGTQSVLADGGAMIWMDAGVQMETNMGGCCAAYWRSTCAGESCCQNTFSGSGKVSFGFVYPGDIQRFSLTKDQSWIVTGGSFICGTTSCLVSAQFIGCQAFCCLDSKPFLTKVTLKDDAEAGSFFAGGYGAIVEKVVEEGKSLTVSAGLFFGTSSKTPISVSFPGLGNCMFSKEICCQGLYMQFNGPCTVYLQNRDPTIWKYVLNRPPPRKKKGVTYETI